MRTIIVCVLALTALTGCAPAADWRVRPVVELATDRLLLADDVAADKRTTGAPVEDLAREAVVLDTAGARAGQLGLDPAVAWAVVGDQIRASKVVQNGLLREWEAGAPAPPDRADSAMLRHSLDQVTEGLLVALSRAGGALTGPDCRSSVEELRQEVARERVLDALHADALRLAVVSLCHPPR
jgi:chorismate mutase